MIASTGGRLRIALSGGATISRNIQGFLTTALVTVIRLFLPVSDMKAKICRIRNDSLAGSFHHKW